MAVPDRKSEHLRIAAGAGVEHHAGSGLADVRLLHRATCVLGRTLQAPLLVSAMTGGTP